MQWGLSFQSIYLQLTIWDILSGIFLLALQLLAARRSTLAALSYELVSINGSKKRLSGLCTALSRGDILAFASKTINLCTFAGFLFRVEMGECSSVRKQFDYRLKTTLSRKLPMFIFTQHSELFCFALQMFCAVLSHSFHTLVTLLFHFHSLICCLLGMCIPKVLS